MGYGFVARNLQASLNAAGGDNGHSGRTRHVRRSYVSRLRDASASQGRLQDASASDAQRWINMVVRLEFTSAFEMLDCVQVVSDHVGRTLAMDDDTQHFVGVAIRESVINAIRHGNRNDASKHVFVEFSTEGQAEAVDLTIRVRDEGEGFDPSAVPDPLAPENLLKPGGRGIFLIRSFMDDVQLVNAPEGGMEMRMIKRVKSRA
jgi:serine/threonine-protein kinase RsbW